MPHKISFIIASIDRDQELQQCITSIEKAHEYRQDISIEILVVIQKTKQKKDILTRYSEIITFYYIDDIGLSVARNFAIAKSTGDYLVFIDDDAMISEEFIDVLSEKIIVHNKVNAFCGRLIDPIKNQFYSECFSDSNCKYLNRFEFSYFMGSAHVLKKSIIEKIGFYDENFGAGTKYPGAEESDMFFRLKRQGEKVVYLPELIFYHPIYSVTPYLKRFNYSYAVGAMLTKQMFLDSNYLFIYLVIISEIVFKSFLRTLQTVFFLKSIETKNLMFRYKSVLIGTLKGVYDYIKSRSNQ
ncbi:MAG: glycosyltransferase [Proteobacteria bacterium]|nr:glycosyltransferase [Pseudomonadota bacterium]